jgi:hypothetical protein
MMAKILMLVCLLIPFLLGVLHLIYTFWGRKLTPRDEDLRNRMENVSPAISNETTMWKCWKGFNASHSISLIMFGLIYGYLAVCKAEVLFGSLFLLLLGFLLLSGLVALAKLYWFSVPFRCLCISLTCYLASIILALSQIG